jgi:hypothetical protein
MKAPQPGVSAGHGRMHLSDDGLSRMGEAHPLGRHGEADQQFGRTRERDRAGSTGRAGCSRAGETLACRFFIDALLVCGRLTHARDEQQTADDSILILTGWSCRVNAPMRNGSAGATLVHISWVIGTCETAGECCHTYDSRSAGTENPGWSASWPPRKRLRQPTIVTNNDTAGEVLQALVRSLGLAKIS